MISSARWVSAASLAMLLAWPCLADDAKPDSAAARSGAAPGRGGVGGLVGGSYFESSDDYSTGALPRFDFSGHYRYVLSRRWRWQVGPEFTWSAYSKNEPPPLVDLAFPSDKTKERYIALLLPVSAQIQLTWGRKSLRYHLGAGPGVYRVWVENHRSVLVDPQTLRLHRGVYWGTTAELGAERFLKTLPNTSVEVSLAHHYVLAKRDDQFKAGWNSSIGALALHAGVNYYFDLKKSKKSTEAPLPKRAR